MSETVESQRSKGPLVGVRVLDLSRVLAGPYCTMMLGDLGAEVIKVERPTFGDDSRHFGPPYIGGESAYFLCTNRNKKSITVDIKSTDGVEIIRKLSEQSDVLVENFLPGAAEQLGIGYKQLSAVNPRLIYTSISGFGQLGPYMDRPGYDVMAAALGGLMGITGEENGPPVKVGVAMTDITTGLMAHGAICAALYARQTTGRGEWIELSLLASQVAALVNIASNYLNGGVIGKRWGTAHHSIVPYQAFEASDGYLVIGALNEGQWNRLCHILDMQHFEHDARFHTNKDRVKNRKELIEIIQQRIKTKTKSEWIATCTEHKIACCPINNIQEVFEDEQVQHLRLLQQIEHPTAGTVRLVGHPVHYSHSQPSIRLAPPLLGQHTEEVMRELLGYDDERIARLRRERVI